MAASGPLVVGLVVLLLAGSGRGLAGHAQFVGECLRQADEVGRIINDMRNFYATDVVGRALAEPPQTVPTANYRNTPGGIPIPATLSIELGKLITPRSEAIDTVVLTCSRPRIPRLDAFEAGAIQALRQDPKTPVVEVSGSIFDSNIRMAGPVVMGAPCVGCHNAHPDSPKKDWKVGDVRGIQEISVAQPIAANLLSFKYLLLYFLPAADRHRLHHAAAPAAGRHRRRKPRTDRGQ